MLYGRIIIITTTTKDWRDYLGERDARRIEELLGPELARFGYERRVGADSGGPAGP